MPDNSLAPPNMPWLWQPNSPVGQPNGLGPPMLNYAAPPDATTSQGADVLAGKAQQAWQWLQDQRAESVRQGLLDPDTGLPTQKGVVEGARATAEGVMMGTTAPGDVPPPGIVAYHASPYDFERFDTSKIGTGQGAQSYGHGLYTAESPAVSGGGGQYDQEFTAKNLGKPDLNQQELGILQGLRQGKSDLNLLGEQARMGATFEEAQAAIDRVKSAKAHIYEVNIGADPEHFLDWDKPLSEQSQHVQDALHRIALGLSPQARSAIKVGMATPMKPAGWLEER